VRGGGNWKRDYGTFYTGTQGETPDTAKELPTDYRASSRPYRDLSERIEKGHHPALRVVLHGQRPVRYSVDSIRIAK
jgi:hypothetical protein